VTNNKQFNTLFSILWQFVKLALFVPLHVASNPGLIVLKEADESMNEFMSLDPREMLARWIDHTLKVANVPVSKPFAQFGADVKDSFIYAHLLAILCPSALPNASQVLDEPNLQTRAEQIISIASSALNFKYKVFIEPTEIETGYARMNLAFMASLFCSTVNNSGGLNKESITADQLLSTRKQIALLKLEQLMTEYPKTRSSSLSVLSDTLNAIFTESGLTTASTHTSNQQQVQQYKQQHVNESPQPAAQVVEPPKPVQHEASEPNNVEPVKQASIIEPSNPPAVEPKDTLSTITALPVQAATDDATQVLLAKQADEITELKEKLSQMQRKATKYAFQCANFKEQLLHSIGETKLQKHQIEDLKQSTRQQVSTLEIQLGAKNKHIAKLEALLDKASLIDDDDN